MKVYGFKFTRQSIRDTSFHWHQKIEDWAFVLMQIRH